MDANESENINVKAKPFKVVVLEGALYFIISALTPVVVVLDSDKVLDSRHVISIVLAAIVAGCTSLKAFFSQSTSSKLSPPPISLSSTRCSLLAGVGFFGVC